jgi:DNA mismatch endonuclease (patch repair protein)
VIEDKTFLKLPSSPSALISDLDVNAETRPSTSPGVSERMSRQAVRDTAPERELRHAIRELGLGYRLHRAVVPGVRRSADIVFIGARVAVFVDGCFWHGCPEHKGMPRRNADWWAEKIARNRARDGDTDERLHAAGWVSIRVWEHEAANEAAVRIAAVVRDRRNRT